MTALPTDLDRSRGVLYAIWFCHICINMSEMKINSHEEGHFNCRIAVTRSHGLFVFWFSISHLIHILRRSLRKIHQPFKFTFAPLRLLFKPPLVSSQSSTQILLLSRPGLLSRLPHRIIGNISSQSYDGTRRGRPMSECRTIREKYGLGVGRYNWVGEARRFGDKMGATIGRASNGMSSTAGL